jgi:hypothetical protein
MMPAAVAAPSPPRPASGERKAPSRNGSAPTQADAVPAMAPWLASAIAVAFGRMLPKKAMKKNSGTRSTASGGCPVSAAARKPVQPAAMTISEPRTTLVTGTRFTSRAPSCAIATRPIELIMKNTLNSCGDSW